MPIESNLSRMAALYERQDDLRHPLGWPHQLAAGVQRLLLRQDSPDTQQAHGAAPAPMQAMLRGARQAAANPLYLPVTLPGTAVLFGGLVPVVAGAVSMAAAATWGTTGLMGSGLPAPMSGLGLRAPLSADGARRSSPTQPYAGAVKTCLAFGIVGVCTELLALQLGRLGARTRQTADAPAIARALGHGAELLGYGLALAVGACLTVGRLVSTSALLVMMAAVQLPAALIGGLWALGSHVWTGAQTPAAAAEADALPPALA